MKGMLSVSLLPGPSTLRTRTTSPKWEVSTGLRQRLEPRAANSDAVRAPIRVEANSGTAKAASVGRIEASKTPNFDASSSCCRRLGTYLQCRFASKRNSNG